MDTNIITGYELINTQLANMLQYIRNVQPTLSTQASEYKNLLNTACLFDQSIIYTNLCIHITPYIVDQINKRNESELIKFLSSFKDDVEVGDIITFVLTTWVEILEPDQRDEIWKFVSLVLKISIKLQNYIKDQKDKTD